MEEEEEAEAAEDQAERESELVYESYIVGMVR
jgi:hypothetical protein